LSFESFLCAIIKDGCGLRATKKFESSYMSWHFTFFFLQSHDTWAQSVKTSKMPFCQCVNCSLYFFPHRHHHPTARPSPRCASLPTPTSLAPFSLSHSRCAGPAPMGQRPLGQRPPPAPSPGPDAPPGPEKTAHGHSLARRSYLAQCRSSDQGPSSPQAARSCAACRASIGALAGDHIAPVPCQLLLLATPGRPSSRSTCSSPSLSVGAPPRC